jgi:hypothetical protein
VGEQHIDHGAAHRLVVVRDDHADHAHAPNAGTRTGRSRVTFNKVLRFGPARMRSQFQDQ